MPVLLVPQRFLRDLPTINSGDFWDFAFTPYAQAIALEFGADITRNVDKKTIMEFARRHPEAVRDFVSEVEARTPKPYDLDGDPLGEVDWVKPTAAYVDANPFHTPPTDATFVAFVDELIQHFKHYVEQNGGWGLLWNEGGRHKRERSAQLLCFGIMLPYCRMFDVDISREPEMGRGPVDFKLSSGFKRRVLLECKYADNPGFRHGIRTQVPIYLKAGAIHVGFYLVVIFDDKDEQRVNDIRVECEEVRRTTGLDVQVRVIDARRPKSASKA